MSETTVTNEQKVRVTFKPVTNGGAAAPVDGPILVEVVSGDSTFTAEEDGSFFLISGGSPGDSTFLVQADADLGSGVELIQDVIILHVVGARAANLGVQFGVPEGK